MKINPIAIQTYQQTAQRQLNRSTEQQKNAESVDQNLTINPQTSAASSDLAVKAPQGSYAEFLTDPEKAALQLLFERFQDTGRFGAAFNRGEAEPGANQTLGKLIDVKV